MARTIAFVLLLAASTALRAHAQEQRAMASAAERPWSTVLRLTGSHDGQPAFRLQLEARDVRLKAEGRAIAAISAGGSLLVVHELLPGYTHADPLRPARSGTRLARTLSVRPAPGGGLQYEYEVNGVAQPFGAEGEAWLGGLLRRYRRH